MQAHNENHDGPAGVLARSRGQVWIHRGRYLARKVEKDCTYCHKKKKMVEQRMGQLPVERIAFGTPPFSAVCLNLLGPVLVKGVVNKSPYEGVAINICLPSYWSCAHLCNARLWDCCISATIPIIREYPRDPCEGGL